MSAPLSQTLAAIGAMVERCRRAGQPYLVLSAINPSYGASGTDNYSRFTTLNTALKALYGNQYLDVRSWLIARGLGVAGITPTTGDITAISEDRIPPSLMADSIHLNNAGRTAAAKLIASVLKARIYA